jgi:hypothetical protein
MHLVLYFMEQRGCATSVTVGLAWPRILPFFRAGVCVCVCVCCMCMSDHPWIIDMEDSVGAQKEEVH